MKNNSMGKLAVLLTLMTLLLTSGSVFADKPPTTSDPAAPQAAEPQVADPPAWHNQYPNLYDIKMISATSGWIVGEGGIIKKFYNNNWGNYPSPVTSTLRSVAALGGETWAVGDRGVALHVVGTNWQVSNTGLPAYISMLDVDITAPGNVWALGCDNCLHDYPGPTASSVILMHYTNGNWAQVSTTAITGSVLVRSMDWVSPNEGWLVGAEYADSETEARAVAYHYLNGSFTRIALPAGVVATSVSMLSASSGFIGAGTNGGEFGVASPPVALRYGGGNWQVFTSTLVSGDKLVEPLSATAPRPDNSGCQFFGLAYYDVQATADNQYFGLLGGGGSVCGYPTPMFGGGKLVRNGTVLSGQPYYGSINSLSTVSSSDVWMVGAAGFIYHWLNGSFTIVSDPGPGGRHVVAISSKDAWVNYAHYNGSSWVRLGYGDDHIPYAFDFAASNDGWYIDRPSTGGGDIQFTHYLSGSFNTVQTANRNYYFYDMQLLNTTQGWSVGSYYSPTSGYVAVSYPAVAQLSGNSWNVYTIGNGMTATLRSVSFSNSTNGWAVGFVDEDYYSALDDRPVVYHYSGSSWQLVALPDDSIIPYSVYALAPNDVWVGGRQRVYPNSNHFWHWNGSNWQATTIPTSFIGSIHMISPTEGWAGGGNDSDDSGALLHYSSGNWQVVNNPASFIADIDFSSPTEGWAVGSYALLHYYPECLDYYADVPAGYWAAGYIRTLSCAGIVNGTGNHIFSPDATATRIQFAKMISLAKGWPLVNPTTPSFSDVPISHVLYRYVETAKANGAINGYAGTTCTDRGVASPCYLPNDNISRAQTALIIVRAYGWPTNTTGGPHFSDVPAATFFYNAVETAYNRGVISGVGGGLFSPDANVTRAQISKMLVLARAQ